MKVHFTTTRSDIDEMRRGPGETEEQQLKRLVAIHLEKATGVAISLTPETAKEEAELQKAMEINAFYQHLLTPPFQLNELGQKEYHFSFC